MDVLEQRRLTQGVNLGIAYETSPCLEFHHHARYEHLHLPQLYMFPMGALYTLTLVYSASA